MPARGLTETTYRRERRGHGLRGAESSHPAPRNHGGLPRCGLGLGRPGAARARPRGSAAIADTVVDSYVEVTDLMQDDIASSRSWCSPRRGLRRRTVYIVKRESSSCDALSTARPAAGPLPSGRCVWSTTTAVTSATSGTTSPGCARDRGTTTAHLDPAGRASRSSLSPKRRRRNITAWAAISPPHRDPGVYGMNFTHMPELDQPWGYPAVLAVIAAVCVSLYRRFKRTGWL